MAYSLDLSGRVALITGASGGLGEQFAKTLARAGAGLLQTYRFIVEADLHSGALREVLPAHAGASRPFSLLYPANRHMPLRVRVLVDFLVDRLARA